MSAPEPPAPGSAPATPEIDEDLLGEIHIALTARWRDEEGRLAVGVGRKKLIAALGVAPEEFDRMLEALEARLAPLGLEVVDYYHGRERWYAARSVHACPNELDEWEQATLGVIIGLLEENDRPTTAKVTPAKLKRLLVRGKYLTQYRLDRILSTLERYGYLVRKRGGFSYGPRTLLEFSEDRRENIRAEAAELIF